MASRHVGISIENTIDRVSLDSVVLGLKSAGVCTQDTIMYRSCSMSGYTPNMMNHHDTTMAILECQAVLSRVLFKAG
jgi:hypothetical protein